MNYQSQHAIRKALDMVPIRCKIALRGPIAIHWPACITPGHVQHCKYLIGIRSAHLLLFHFDLVSVRMKWEDFDLISHAFESDILFLLLFLLLFSWNLLGMAVARWLGKTLIIILCWGALADGRRIRTSISPWVSSRPENTFRQRIPRVLCMRMSRLAVLRPVEREQNVDAKGVCAKFETAFCY